MTDSQRFTQVMAVMMGIEGLKESFVAKWLPITPDGEITPECRKWLGKETWWNTYLVHCSNQARESVGVNSIKWLYLVLSAENLWRWMCANRDKWLYEKCPKCSGTEFSNVEHVGRFICDLCNGTGRVAKWDVEKWLEV